MNDQAMGPREREKRRRKTRESLLLWLKRLRRASRTWRTAAPVG